MKPAPVSNILAGSRTVNAMDLKKIAGFCNISMDRLVALPEKPVETNVVRAFMGQVKTKEAKKELKWLTNLLICICSILVYMKVEWLV